MRLHRTGNIVDVISGRIMPGTLHVVDGRIEKIVQHHCQETQFILPGFVDAHVHIESSMLPPTEFARLAMVHGTVATVSDPHEIGNVLGEEGVRYMLDNASASPLKICFGAPSCVPATSFETAGATIDVEAIERLFADRRVGYLSEMMNFPGVLHGDPIVMQKIAVAKKMRRPVDGHAPGLRGSDAARYCAAGISTDHECFELDEALDKLKVGMKILIREGSAAKNYDALHSLLSSHPEMVMLCSDDKHPDALVRSHIDELVRRSIAKGHPLFNVLRAASVNPVRHYNLDVGLLQIGDPADFIVVEDLEKLRVIETFINGVQVAENGRSLTMYQPALTPNNFIEREVTAGSIVVPSKAARIRVIEALDGQLITNSIEVDTPQFDGNVVSDITRDILKMVVVSRYDHTPPSVAFIRNIGLQSGAIASSVAHDSHNVIAVGCSDAEICTAINAVMKSKGGVCVTEGTTTDLLPLPIAGLMSDADGYLVAARYAELDRKAKALGSTLAAPFMTLSFMALLVIPHLKLSDRGLFNGDRFEFSSLSVL